MDVALELVTPSPVQVGPLPDRLVASFLATKGNGVSMS
jgi:hypothetical protein